MKSKQKIIDALKRNLQQRSKFKTKNMILKILFFLLPLLSNCLIFQRLSTLGQQSLKVNDYVYSTLGYFRLSLQQKTCQIKIQSFDENNTRSYNVIGYFPKNKLSECQQLSFNQSGLFTSKGKEIFFFKNQLSQNNSQQDLNKNIKQTFLTIDDTGVVRLQSIFSDQSTREKWITNFKTPQKYIFTSNNKIISNLSSLSIIKSNGDWGFSASKGELRIFYLGDRSRITRYRFLPFILSTNVFKDWNDFTTPLLNFQGLKYQGRCGISKQISFRSPFVFVLNSYWPQLRVLDQQGYELFNMRFPSLNCIKDVGIDKLVKNNDCISWFCPPQTFELNGKCLTKCPAPYFHQIKHHGRNRCVLICEAGSDINNITNWCTCTQKSTLVCPKNLVSTPFGCLCKNQTFFYNTKQILDLNNVPNDEICLKNCPIRFYEHSDGICVNCPVFCLKCTVTNSSISFFKCLQCEQGFEVFNFYCRKTCQNRVTNYLNPLSNSCDTCKIRNCRKCKFIGNNTEICQQCMLPFALFDNICLNTCPKNSTLNFNNYQAFECNLIGKCSSLVAKIKNTQLIQCKTCGTRDVCFESCQQNMEHFIHNRSMCYCLENNNPSFVANCNFSSVQIAKNQITYNNFLQYNPCPIILYYYNYRTNQCLKCPFGCLTCLINQKGIPQCTSCVENYYLSIYDATYCQKQTSLAYCYGFNREEKYCFTWDDIDGLIEKDVNHILCKKTDSNCFICMYKSSAYCKFCKNSYFLHQGRCVKFCPQGFYPYDYQHVCLPKTIKNCKTQKVESINYLINTNSNTQFTEGYRYFTSKFFTQIQNENDPIGLIYVYYGYLKRKIQGQRMSSFTQGVSKCRVCNDGYGLTSQGFCEKCQPNCQVCIFSYVFSCVKCHPFYYLSDHQECLPKKQKDRPCLNGQYRTQDGICKNECLQFKKLMTNQLLFNPNQKIINCTLNCPQSMKIMKSTDGDLFCIESELKNQSVAFFSRKQEYIEIKLQQINQPPIKLISSCFPGQNGNGICIISASSKIKNLTQTALKLQLLTQSTSRLLQSQKVSSEITVSENIIVINNLKKGVVKAVFSISQFSNPQNNEYLANTVYGFEINEGGSMLDQILLADHGMHVYSRLIVILFLTVAIINFGKGLDYKVDNVFITMGTVYLALTGFSLSLGKGAYSFYGWLYGFSWSLGLEFFSDPRSLTYGGTFFDGSFIQNSSSNAHFLLFVDDNLIRNCWSIFILLFVIICLLTFSWIITKLCTQESAINCKSFKPQEKQASQSTDRLKSSQQSSQDEKQVYQIIRPQSKQCFKLLPKIDFDHFSKIRAFCVFLIENSMLALVYYGFLQISSRQWKLASAEQLIPYKVFAWFLLIVIFIYSIVRFYTNFTAGIYLLKRIMIALVLLINPASEGEISMFLGLLCVQLIFTGFRLYLECSWEIFQIFVSIKKSIKQRKLKSEKIRQDIKNLETGEKKGDQKSSNLNKAQQVFYFQKAMISNQTLPNIQESQMVKNTIKTLPSLPTSKQKIEKSQLPKSSGLEIQMSVELKILLIEETLIIVIYLMLAMNSIMAEVSVFIIFVILMVFLVSLLDQLIINVIEYSELISRKISDNNSLICQLNKNLNKSQNKYYFRIRNNFDFQKQTLSSISTDFSSTLSKQRKSSLNSSYIHSAI